MAHILAAGSVSKSTGMLFAVVFLLVICLTADCSQVYNVSLGVGSEAQAVLTSGLHSGVCLLKNDSNVGEAFCAALLKRPRVIPAVTRNFTGSSALPTRVGINGCQEFKPGIWDLSNNCNLVVGDLPPTCNSLRLAVECNQVELRPGPEEGLVLTDLGGQLGSVCADGTGFNEAAAVCRSLGIANPERGYPTIGRFKPNASKPEEINPIVETLRCQPGDHINACSWRPANPSSCSASNRFAVVCPSAIPTVKPMPSPSLTCYRQSASVCFPTNSLASPADLKVMLDANTTSPCNVSSTENSTHICLNVKYYASCTLGVYHPGLDYTQYHLLVRFLGEIDDRGNYVRPQLDYNLFCRLTGESLATARSLAPDFATPTSAIDGHIGGTPVVEFYLDLQNGLFEQPVTGSVPIGTILYAAVLLRNVGSDAWLVVNDCWAMDGGLNVTMVQNKCPAHSDIVLIPVNATAIAVRFQAFQFNDTSASGRIQLQCTTIACRVGDPSEECSRSCLNYYSHQRHPASADQPQVERQMTPPAFFSVCRDCPAKVASRLNTGSWASAIAASLGVLATLLSAFYVILKLTFYERKLSMTMNDLCLGQAIEL